MSIAYKNPFDWETVTWAVIVGVGIGYMLGVFIGGGV